MFARVGSALLLVASLTQAAEIHGKVVNVRGGEALGRVQVSVLQTRTAVETAPDGTFVLTSLLPGSYTLRANAVGFRLLEVPVSIVGAEDVSELTITLVPDNFRHTETIEVHSDVFQASDSAAVVEENLTSSEIKQAATVFADDAFRALQALPGVSPSGNNELLAEFSVMGAPFGSVGIYLDDVVVDSPFHTLPNVTNKASLSFLTGEVIDEMKLMPVAYPEKYGEKIGAALAIHTREGSRTAPLLRVSVGMADSDFLGEGRLGNSKRGSWLATARKSYLGYLVRNRVEDFSDISFYDASLRLTYDATPNHSLNFLGLGGHTHVSNPNSPSSDPSLIEEGTSDFTFLRAGWRWSVSPRLLIDSRAAYISQPFTAHNISLPQDFAYREWTGGSNVVWNWRSNAVLEGGWSLRHQHTEDTLLLPSAPMPADIHTRLRGDTFVQQSFSFLNNRVHLQGGARLDRREGLDENPLSPQVSVALEARRSTQLQFGFGRYNQFQLAEGGAPEGVCGPRTMGFQRSNQSTAGVEQRFGEKTRLRLQVFDRQSSDYSAFRNNPLCPVPTLPDDTFKQRKYYSRGAQVVLQRRSANRLSGWIGYTLVFAKQSDLFAETEPLTFSFSPYYYAPVDQRHSVNAFATYRLRPTVNVSGKFVFGSGFPVTGGLEAGPDGKPRPAPVQRLDPYARLDFRVDKCWAFTRWKTTLYVEVLNLTDHDNRIVTSTSFVDNKLVVNTERALPITPTAGLVFEF